MTKRKKGEKNIYSFTCIVSIFVSSSDFLHPPPSVSILLKLLEVTGVEICLEL